MQHSPKNKQFYRRCALGITIAAQLIEINPSTATSKALQSTTCQSNSHKTNFIAFGGGPEPAANEIALEKNLLYFQRTLSTLGYNPALASIFFANGNNRQATVRYLDKQQRERFKVPEIPNLKGASTLPNLQSLLQQTARQQPNKPIFFYYTGHGMPNRENLNNNYLGLWNQQQLSVKQFAQMLDKLPKQTPVVTMMAQCFSGSFANFIYQGGNPKGSIALQTRCGFFATVKTRPSVGCTPEVNEADYRDYSSSFFAGLSGRSRIGQIVDNADYNKDQRVSFAEAHAFAKVDDKSMDLPISTSEAWLQDRTSKKDLELIIAQPINKLLQTARPEQSYVVDSLTKMFGFKPEKSFMDNLETLSETQINTEEQEALLKRLAMELNNIGMEKNIRSANNQQAIAILDRLIKCESGSWDTSSKELATSNY